MCRFKLMIISRFGKFLLKLIFNNMFSYQASLFKQIHAIMQITHKASMIINNSGLLSFNCIISIRDSNHFVNLAVNPEFESIFYVYDLVNAS